MKLTLWGTPRPDHVKEYGGWQCSRPECTKRRATNHRYCRDCRAAYERRRRMVAACTALSLALAGCAVTPPRFFTAEQDAAIRDMCAPTGCWILQKPAQEPPPQGPRI